MLNDDVERHFKSRIAELELELNKVYAEKHEEILAHQKTARQFVDQKSFADHLEIKYEKLVLEHKRQREYAINYTGLEAPPCPFCLYVEGEFLNACGFHKVIKMLEQALVKE